MSTKSRNVRRRLGEWWDRMRQPWACYVQTRDWPVGIGTTSESLPREIRYAAVRGMGEPKQRVTVREETTDE